MTPPWLTWTRAREIRYDWRRVPRPTSAPPLPPPNPRAVIEADVYERRDGCWVWSASVAPLVPLPDLTGEGDFGLAPGVPTTQHDTVVPDEASARTCAEAWITATLAPK